MATYSDGRYIDRVAGADLHLPSNLFRIVKQQADATNPTGRSVVLASSATDFFIGVLNNTPYQGETANIVGRNANGTFKVVLNGTVALGDALTSDATGAAITTVTAGNQIIGFAQEAGVAGQVIEYLPTDNKV